MGSVFESLESRTLLSAAPSVSALGFEARVVAADLSAFGKGGKASFDLIEADLKAAGELKSSKALVKTLDAAGAAAFKVTSRGVAKTGSLIKSDVNRLVKAAGKLAKHPTNVELQAKVTAAADTLQTDAANRLSTITSDLTVENGTDDMYVQELESANPSNTQLASDVTNVIGPRATVDRTALSEAATTSLTTDVNAVIAAFPA